jgi:hypothetical protein
MQNINQEHPEYRTNRALWQAYSDLYAGGEQFRKHAADYLIRRNREPGEVYLERLEPILQFAGPHENGTAFFNSFVENCDLKGTKLSEFFQRRLAETLVYGKSYFAIDFPKVYAEVSSRAEEDLLGKSRAYLTEYSARELINWDVDDNGRFEWVVLRTSHLRQRQAGEGDWYHETSWLYYDRVNYRLYRTEGDNSESKNVPVLIDEGKHGLAAQNQVPLFEMRVSEGLWLMNKTAMLQLEHFNKSNALSWALTMGLFATPVVYSDREWNQIVGESYYIQLGPNDRFGWTEPEGQVFQIATSNLERLKDEIYRVCYQMNQAGGSQVASIQSGISKQRDFSVTQEILRAFGSLVKDSIGQTLAAINAARQDGLSIVVSGLDEFEIGEFSAELDDAKKLLELGIQSDTFKKQLYKRVALKYLSDLSQDIKNQIAAEIDSSFPAVI